MRSLKELIFGKEISLREKGEDGSPEERYAVQSYLTQCFNVGRITRFLLWRHREKMITILEREFRRCENSAKQFALHGGYGPIKQNFQNLDGFESDPKAPYQYGQSMAFLGETYHSEGFVQATVIEDSLDEDEHCPDHADAGLDRLHG
jgi:hypothetical protein